jgi:membrane protein YdbS with pleckstrin-like domain
MDTSYRLLGPKTLRFLLLKRSILPVILIVINVLLITWFPYVPNQYHNIAAQGIFLFTLSVFLICIGVVFFTRLEYTHYGIVVANQNIKIHKGIFKQEEFGVPFRRITNIKLTRGIIGQIMGVSRMEISVIADDEESTKEDEDSVIIPLIETSFAKELQDMILHRAQVDTMQMERSVQR